jgi:uncharacterized protein (TIGR03382 family)
MYVQTQINPIGNRDESLRYREEELMSTNHRRRSWFGLAIAALAATATLTVAHTAYAQEACESGVDDDGDGLVDLNDPDCACAPSIVQPVSLIPNPSFENQSGCPSNFGQLNFADNWAQATFATSDYLHTCGFLGAGSITVPQPFPDGNGAAGAILVDAGTTEYLGNCLTSPFVAGTTYRLEFQAGAALPGSQPFGGNTSGDLVLLGLATCPSFPITGQDNKEDDFDVIATANVSLTGGGPYQTVTMEFTATQNYQAILLGPGLNMSVAAGNTGNYVVFDNLTLADTSAFSGVSVLSGDACTSDLLLEADIPSVGGPYTVQWFLDGVAQPGATSATFAVPPGFEGDVIARLDDGASCFAPAVGDGLEVSLAACPCIDDTVGGVDSFCNAAAPACATLGGNNVCVECTVNADCLSGGACAGNTCQAPICGDGIINGADQCDDGGVNTATCDSDCTFPTCGDAIANTAAGEACDDGGESAACNADCTTSVCGDTKVNASAGEDCDDGAESATCDANCTNAECGDATLNTTSGELCDDGGESAVCDIDCTPAMCGDATLNTTSGEACDDGGESATCDPDCTPAVCGDATLNTTSGEACDDGGESATCDPECTPAVCGDATHNATAGEACDDGGESATCDPDCTPAECGDATHNATAGEECDDGDADNTNACLNVCVAATCGDGFVFDGVEQCDDGNTQSGDPCTAACLTDADSDTVADDDDNCRDVVNPDQANADGDALGDACDPDADGDGFNDDLIPAGSGCSAAGDRGAAGALALVLLALLGVTRRRPNRRAAR